MLTPKMLYNRSGIKWSRNQLWNQCTHFRHPSDEQFYYDLYRYFEQQQFPVCPLWILLNERLLMRYIHLSVNLAKVTVSSKVVRGQEHGVRIRLGNWLNKIWPINSNSCLLVTQIRQKRSVSIALFWKLFIYNNFICIKVDGKKKDESKKGFNREELNPPSAL